MKTNKESKNKSGFKRAFIAGILIIAALSVLISLLAVSIIRKFDKTPEVEETEENLPPDVSLDPDPKKKDTVFVDRIDTVTVYKYLNPISKPTEGTSEGKEDTTSK